MALLKCVKLTVLEEAEFNARKCIKMIEEDVGVPIGIDIEDIRNDPEAFLFVRNVKGFPCIEVAEFAESLMKMSLPRDATRSIFRHVFAEGLKLLQDKVVYLTNLLIKKRDEHFENTAPMLDTMIDGTKFSAWRMLHPHFYELLTFTGACNGNWNLNLTRAQFEDFAWVTQERAWLSQPALNMLEFMPLKTKQLVLCVLIEIMEKQMMNDHSSFPGDVKKMLKLDPLTPAIYYLHWDHEKIAKGSFFQNIETSADLYYESWQFPFRKSQECPRLIWSTSRMFEDEWVMHDYVKIHKEFMTEPWQTLWPKSIVRKIEKNIELCKLDSSVLFRHPCRFLCNFVGSRAA